MLGVRALAQGRLDLVASPDVIRPFLALGLGVERRVEPSLRATSCFRSTNANVASASARHRGSLVISKASQVHRGELGVVVEHLLEVRHDPVAVGGVAVIAAAEVVANAAAGHPVERETSPSRAAGDSVPRSQAPPRPVLIEQEDQVDRLGELGPLGVRGIEAEPAVLGVELLRELGLALRRPRPATGAALRCAAGGLEPRRAALRSRQSAALSMLGRWSLPQAFGHFGDDASGTPAIPRDRAAESRCRRRTGGRRASGTSTSASRPGPSA